MKILIVKLSSLGDVVHAMPAVQDIRRAFPHAQIDWVVERGFAPLVRRCAGVHRVIECELRRWRKSPFSAPTRQAWRAFKTELQRERYDAVIDLQGLSKSALVAWLAKLTPNGQRMGLANQTEGSSFEAPARWVADVALTLPAHIHAVARSRELCARALGYAVPDHLTFGLAAPVDAAQSVDNNTVLEARFPQGTVALVHGTSRADKEWPLAHWVALGQRLNDRGYAVALPHGSEAEQRCAQDIADQLAGAVVWPRLGLDALLDAMAGCVGVVGVDSGLSHMAVALDLPHVQIYNFDTAWRTGPGSQMRGGGPAESGVKPHTDLEQAAPLASSWRAQRGHPRPRDTTVDCRAVSVFAQPSPTVEAVWQAWRAVSALRSADGLVVSAVQAA